MVGAVLSISNNKAATGEDQREETGNEIIYA